MTATQTVLPSTRARIVPDETVETGSEGELLAALRDGDQAAYLALVRRFTPLMLRLARPYVPSTAAAEDVVQDTWVAVLRHVHAFEGRSSFKTWLLRVLLNTARTRGVRERRMICWSSLGREPGDWETWLPADVCTPETKAIGRETITMVDQALRLLPEQQRTVVMLRDVEGWSGEEVCHTLGISTGNQRVLLHRGRARLRQALRPYLQERARSA